MATFTRSDELRGAEFVNADLRGARFVGADLSGVVMRAVDVSGTEIDAPWLFDGDGSLRVNGVDVIPFVEAELNRRFPGRADRRAADPDGLRAAWAMLERTWAATLERDRLPELVVTLDDAPAPDDDAVLADSVGLALLVVLDSLRPSERLAFVLHDLFAVPFDEIGRILGKSTDATKMLASRARRKVQATERPTGAGREQREVVSAFLAAARGGDFEGLLRVLDPEVRLTVDTPGGVVVTLGATKVAAGAQLAASAATLGRAALVGGLPGVISWREDGTPLSVLAFTVTDGRITGITAVVDPAKLARLNLPGPA